MLEGELAGKVRSPVLRAIVADGLGGNNTTTSSPYNSETAGAEPPMIRVCPGYERDDGTMVHDEPIILGEKEPLDDKRETCAYCPDCYSAFCEDTRAFLRDKPHGTKRDHWIGEKASA